MQELDLRQKTRNERFKEIEELIHNGYVAVEGRAEDILDYAKGAKDIIHLPGHDKNHIKGGGFEEYLVSGLKNLNDNVTVVTLYDNVNHSIDPELVTEHIVDVLYNECKCLYCVLTFHKEGEIIKDVHF